MNTTTLPPRDAFIGHPLRVADRAVREQTASLLRHVQHCERARSRWFDLFCLGEALHGIVAPRFVTTVAAAGVLLFLTTWWA
jgi:hypothetical protein